MCDFIIVHAAVALCSHILVRCRGAQHAPVEFIPLMPLSLLPTSLMYIYPAGTAQQVADQKDRLVAAVEQLLSPGATDTFVAAVAGGPAADAAGGEAGGAFQVQSAEERTPVAPGSAAAGGPGALPKDGFMAFEGPSFSTFSTQSSEPAAAKGKRGGDVSATGLDTMPPLQVTRPAPISSRCHAGPSSMCDAAAHTALFPLPPACEWQLTAAAPWPSLAPCRSR